MRFSGFPQLALNLHAHGLDVLTLARPLQYGQSSSHCRARFAVALAGHLHEAELRDGQDVGLALSRRKPSFMREYTAWLAAPGFHASMKSSTMRPPMLRRRNCRRDLRRGPRRFNL